MSPPANVAAPPSTKPCARDDERIVSIILTDTSPLFALAVADSLDALLPALERFLRGIGNRGKSLTIYLIPN
jgi:hypothetical protein